MRYLIKVVLLGVNCFPREAFSFPVVLPPSSIDDIFLNKYQWDRNRSVCGQKKRLYNHVTSSSRRQRRCTGLSRLHVWKPENDDHYWMFAGRYGRREPGSGYGGKESFVSKIKRAVLPVGLGRSSLQNQLIGFLILCYLYQLGSAVYATPTVNAKFRGAGYLGRRFTRRQVLETNLMGASSASSVTFLSRYVGYGYKRMPSLVSFSGPLSTDFLFIPRLSPFQPHRYLTSGFLHGSLLHIWCNVRSMSWIPSWLESALGKPLYLTAFLVSIVTGNVAHYMNGFLSNRVNSLPSCLGASGGICGLNGLMFVLFRKMSRPVQSTVLMRRMFILFLLGALDPSISNASHVGGFVGGMLVGTLCAPSFQRSYSSRVYNENSSNFAMRALMGPSFDESEPILKLEYLWGGIALYLCYHARYRRIPLMVGKALLKPGTLSGF